MVYESVKLELKSIDVRVHFEEGVSTDIYLNEKDCFALLKRGYVYKDAYHPNGNWMSIKINKDDV